MPPTDGQDAAPEGQSRGRVSPGTSVLHCGSGSSTVVYLIVRPYTEYQIMTGDPLQFFTVSKQCTFFRLLSHLINQVGIITVLDVYGAQTRTD